jgi:HK97 gp10 family phage protein
VARSRVRIEGLRELEAALADLPKATGKNVLRRVLKKAAAPIENAAASAAPVRTGVLQFNVAASFQLNANQKKAVRQSGDKSSAEIHVGVRSGKSVSGADAFAQVAGIQTEFGNAHQAAQPWLRPAWDANKDGALRTIAADLGTEIEKAAKRQARKTARLAAKG